MAKVDLLEFQFVKGGEPSNLEGFYKGSLELFIPGTFLESIAGLILKFWVPWYGKEFGNQSNYNFISPLFLLPIILLFGPKPLLKIGPTLHAFPFKTKIVKSLKDKIQVLQLDYDVPENPVRVRNVVDELVEIEKNIYLGKAYLKEKGSLRLLAYFRLEK